MLEKDWKPTMSEWLADKLLVSFLFLNVKSTRPILFLS